MAKSDFFRLNLKKVTMLRLVIRFRSKIFFYGQSRANTKKVASEIVFFRIAVILSPWLD